MTATDQNQTPHGRAAIYTRKQQAQAQKRHPQIAELVAFVQEHGYGDERITVFEEGSVSGTVAMLKREAFEALLTDITTPAPDRAPICAIFVYSVERLFGYASTQDIVSFIDTCLTHGVMVITPTTEYDFRNASHVVQFCFTCQSADQRVAAVITSRLHAGKRAAAARRKAQTTN